MSTQVGFYRAWRDLMRSWGFTVHEAAGWETRDAEPRTGYAPGMLYVEHHDASTKLSGNWGALAYIINNRLANIVTARDGQIMLCAAGVCWHAGVGAWGDIPANGANPRSLGNEVCNSGSEPYDPRCTEAIVATEKAWAIVSGRDHTRVIGHKEWAMPRGRKSDPSIDMNWRRSQVAAFQPEDDMPLTNDDIAKIAKAVWEYNLGRTKGGTERDPVDVPAETAGNRLSAIRRNSLGVRDWLRDLMDRGSDQTPPAA